MSNFSININGGNVSFGAASQGNRNNVTGNASINIEHEVQELAKQNNKANEDAAEALRLVQELIVSVEKKDKGNSSKLIATIKENYSWVIPAIRDAIKCFVNF